MRKRVKLIDIYGKDWTNRLTRAVKEVCDD